MSQKKVDVYKEQKANRDKIMKKEKRILRLEKLIACVFCAVVVVWIGFSVYSKVNEGKETVVLNTEMDTTALDNYLSEVSTAATEEADADADTTEDAETDTDADAAADAEVDADADAATDVEADTDTADAETDTEATAEASAETDTDADAE